ncbi:hypothetical protein FOL47_003032 [Perkinsus chesapeaki]|uniref:Uncharacterized protein n=1 Tax=Perkinsus chesapeaki TaxID=330153 RepID=A0A7J6MA90_PERCH|nr:hypothetical protein FOL47_003032 [Perkinsus chesapeaki]
MAVAEMTPPDMLPNILSGPLPIGKYDIVGKHPHIPIKEISILSGSRILFITPGPDIRATYTMSATGDAIFPSLNKKDIEALKTEFPKYFNDKTIVKLDCATEGSALAIVFSNGEDIYYSHQAALLPFNV